MKRVYFSAYVPVGVHPSLPPPKTEVPLRREHRLYQADWLMRFYEFSADEITEDDDSLDLELDPKCAWAIRHPEFFPVDVNSAPYGALLRVPGIGVKTAKRIIAARKNAKLDIGDLRRLGAVTKRAVFFVCFGARFYGLKQQSKALLKAQLSDSAVQGTQLTLDETIPQISVAVPLITGSAKRSEAVT